MKQDRTIRVAITIDVRGKNNRRCGVGCRYHMASAYEAECDAFFTDDSDPVPLRKSKFPGEYLRCRACRDAEVKG